jgi:hypothetical protein
LVSWVVAVNTAGAARGLRTVIVALPVITPGLQLVESKTASTVYVVVVAGVTIREIEGSHIGPDGGALASDQITVQGPVPVSVA